MIDQIETHIQEATHKTLSTLIVDEVNVQPVDITDTLLRDHDVVAFMPIYGDVAGIVYMALNSTFACDLIGRMTGESYTHIDLDVRDGIGEILNSIIGSAKTEIGFENCHIMLTYPVIVHGASSDLYFNGDISHRLLHGQAAGYDFFVGVWTKQTGNEFGDVHEAGCL